MSKEKICINDKEIFITVDIDWAADDVIEYVIQYFEEMNVAVTFFVTHKTPLLDKIRKNPRFELGIHPNFNDLLSGKAEVGENIYTILKSLIDIVPEARSVRSHSLTQGSRFSAAYKEFGLYYDCNPFIPITSDVIVNPWRFRNGVIVVPFGWSDYMHCSYLWDWNVENYLNVDGLKVFAFHPIHIALNTRDLVVYQQHKHQLHRLRDVREFRCNDLDFGTEVFLHNLINRAQENGFKTQNISNIGTETTAEL